PDDTFHTNARFGSRERIPDGDRTCPRIRRTGTHGVFRWDQTVSQRVAAASESFARSLRGRPRKEDREARRPVAFGGKGGSPTWRAALLLRKSKVQQLPPSRPAGGDDRSGSDHDRGEPSDGGTSGVDRLSVGQHGPRIRTVQ